MAWRPGPQVRLPETVIFEDGWTHLLTKTVVAHRIIRDQSNLEWEVWEVVPPKSKTGWLAFQSKTEKRRLQSIPSGWSELPESELIALLDQAEIGGKPKRLIE